MNPPEPCEHEFKGGSYCVNCGWSKVQIEAYNYGKSEGILIGEKRGVEKAIVEIESYKRASISDGTKDEFNRGWISCCDVILHRLKSLLAKNANEVKP